MSVPAGAGAGEGAGVRVGVVGLGRMGAPLAGHLVAAGYEVSGVDPDPQAAAVPGVRRVPDVEGLADCGVVLVTTPGPAVAEVLFRGETLRGGLAAADLVVCSTVAPTEMARLHERAVAAGGSLLDAPLCRGDHGAREGRLLALVGGSASLLERVRPVLGAFCSDVVHVGGPAAGQTAKLVNNLLLWSHLAAAVEGLRLAEQLGVHRGPLVAGLLGSSAGSWVLDTWVRPREMPWAAEDLRLAAEEAAACGVELSTLDSVARVVAQAREAGLLLDGGLGRAGWALPAYPEDPPA